MRWRLYYNARPALVDFWALTFSIDRTGDVQPVAGHMSRPEVIQHEMPEYTCFVHRGIVVPLRPRPSERPSQHARYLEQAESIFRDHATKIFIESKFLALLIKTAQPRYSRSLDHLVALTKREQDVIRLSEGPRKQTDRPATRYCRGDRQTSFAQHLSQTWCGRPRGAVSPVSAITLNL